MKKLLILTLMMLVALSNVVCAQPSDEEVVASFKQYVGEELSKAISTYKIDNYEIRKSGGKWYKFSENLDPNYTIDVRKNDSLTTPYIGSAVISRVFKRGENWPTKELAEISTASDIYDIFKYRFIGVYRDNEWVVTKVEYNNYVEEITGIYDRLKDN
ncbi:MAG: hypothetical protein H6Q67_2114 [Firmicutes bacterium]|nr:hypothetical protein [Bacillota bacterium]